MKKIHDTETSFWELIHQGCPALPLGGDISATVSQILHAIADDGDTENLRTPIILFLHGKKLDVLKFYCAPQILHYRQ